MKWFDHWFARKCRWAWEHTREFADEPRPLNATKIRSTGEDWEDDINVTVKRMIGGSVVTFRTYDHAKDRTDRRHYIITDEQDFNTELTKMITMESLRRS